MNILGKWILLSFFAVYLLIDAVFLAVWIERENLIKVTSTIVRSCIAAGLFIAIYRGHKWARNLLCMFLALGILVGVIAIVSAVNVVMFAFIAYMVGFFYVLLLSNSVTQFLEQQRLKYGL